MQVIGGDDPSGRVVGRVEDHELGAPIQAGVEFLEVEAEVTVLAQRQSDRGAPGPADRRLVDRKAGIGVDHLVAGLAHGEHGEEQERLGSVSDEHPLGGDGEAAAA